MQPAYYEDLKEIQNKYWAMLDDAVKNRSSPLEFQYLFVQTKTKLMVE